MSKVLAINKSEKESIFVLSKDNDFYKQITKTLLDLGLKEWQLPVDFPCNLSKNDGPLDLTKESDFYNQTRETAFSLNFFYGKDKIFVILSADENFLEKFNDEFNKNFSF